MHLSLNVKSRLVPFFFQLLGHGFSVNVMTGSSVKNVLCEQLEIDEDYLAQRIQTIFLNGKVVDDNNSAIVNEDSVLALSGAMPGLAGAILRSGGYYAAMRNQISHEESKSSSQAQFAKITLKLMNLVVKELGPVFLQQGIRLKSQSLCEFFKRHLDELKDGFISSELDGEPVEFESLRGIDWNADTVLLQVNSETVG
jgi:hypothetical protein